MDHCFQVIGLGKEIGEGDGFDPVAGGEERAQVAGQRGGIAGDAGQGRGGDCGQQRAALRAQANARRVYHD